MSERPRSDLAARIVAEGSPSRMLAALQRQALAGRGEGEGPLARRIRLVRDERACERAACDKPREPGEQWLADVHHGTNRTELVRLCESCAVELSRWLYGERG